MLSGGSKKGPKVDGEEQRRPGRLGGPQVSRRTGYCCVVPKSPGSPEIKGPKQPSVLTSPRFGIARPFRWGGALRLGSVAPRPPRVFVPANRFDHLELGGRTVVASGRNLGDPASRSFHSSTPSPSVYRSVPDPYLGSCDPSPVVRVPPDRSSALSRVPLPDRWWGPLSSAPGEVACR